MPPGPICMGDPQIRQSVNQSVKAALSWRDALTSTVSRWVPLHSTHKRLMHDACDAHTTTCDDKCVPPLAVLSIEHQPFAMTVTTPAITTRVGLTPCPLELASRTPNRSTSHRACLQKTSQQSDCDKPHVMSSCHVAQARCTCPTHHTCVAELQLTAAVVTPTAAAAVRDQDPCVRYNF